jgi:hypothetical protein
LAGLFQTLNHPKTLTSSPGQIAAGAASVAGLFQTLNHP